MSAAMTGFVIGFFIGGSFGVLVTAVVAAGRTDEDYEEIGQVRVLAHEAHSEEHERAMREERKRHDDEMAVLQQSHEKDMQTLRESFEASIKHERKAEYKRGYDDGRKSKDASEWQLEHDRLCALARLSETECSHGGVMRDFAHVFGTKWNSDNVPRSIGLMKARIAYLLGQDREDQNLQKSPDLPNSKGQEVPNLEKAQESTDEGVDKHSYLELLRDACRQYKYVCGERDAWRDICEGKGDEDLMEEVGFLRLPTDADGKPIHNGDMLEPATPNADTLFGTHLTENPFPAKLWYGYLDGRYGMNLSAPFEAGSASVNPSRYRHAREMAVTERDEVDDMVEEFYCGNITKAQLAEEIRRLAADASEVKNEG